MLVSVDGVKVLDATVKSTGWSDYNSKVINVSAGAHTIAVSFDNDKYQPKSKCDRNLRLDKLTFTP